jgi:hypothetical protein
MLVGTDEPQTTTSPELLIEEARQRQRQRARRRTAVLVAVGVFAMLGFGIYRVAQGGGADAATRGAAAVAAAPKPTVLYRKIETVKIVPHLPVERRTVEVWTASNAPLGYRELLKTTGQPSLEIGAAASHDPTLGRLHAAYLYQASTNPLYQTGAELVPPPPPQPQASNPEQAYRRLIAQPGVRLSGTSTVNGHPVYVIRLPARGDIDIRGAVLYIDQRTYLPIMTVFHSTDYTVIKRMLDRKILPATEANLKLTTLTNAHSGARIRPATPRIKAIYGLATMWDNHSPDGVSVGM